MGAVFKEGRETIKENVGKLPAAKAAKNSKKLARNTLVGQALDGGGESVLDQTGIAQTEKARRSLLGNL